MNRRAKMMRLEFLLTRNFLELPAEKETFNQNGTSVGGNFVLRWDRLKWICRFASSTTVPSLHELSAAMSDFIWGGGTSV